MIRILDGKEIEMTELEIQQLEQSRVVTWSKEQHLAEINALHEAEFDRRWRSTDYVGRWEVASAANDESNPYNSEAKAIMDYWWNGWSAIKAYGETVTEQTMKTLIEIVGL